MCFPVAFQSPQLTEGLVTLGAAVGPEARVGAQVDVEVPFVAETFLTDFTGIRLLPCVDLLVTAQRGVVGKRLLTDMTAVRLLASVDSLVDSEIRRLHEPLGTRLAPEGSLSGVCPVVNS